MPESIFLKYYSSLSDALISASSSGVRSCPCCKTAWSIAAGTKCSSLPLITKSQFFSLGMVRQSAVFRCGIVDVSWMIRFSLDPVIIKHTKDTLAQQGVINY